jgi:hypothetical protein
MCINTNHDQNLAIATVNPKSADNPTVRAHFPSHLHLTSDFQQGICTKRTFKP